VCAIQSNLRFFLLYKKAHVFEKGCIVAKKGEYVPFLREMCPFKKMTPQVGCNITAITGKLLTTCMDIHMYSDTYNNIL
jgi:hypothetical protein